MSKVEDLAKVMEQMPALKKTGNLSSWKAAGDRRREYFIIKASTMLKQLHAAGYEAVKTRHLGGEP